MQLKRSLKRNYQVEQPNGVVHTYPSDKFDVLITFLNKSAQEILEVDTQIVNKETLQPVLSLPKYNYTKQGEEGPVKNQDAINKFNDEMKVLSDQMKVLEEEKDKAHLAHKKESPLNDDNSENPNYQITLDAYNKAEVALREKRQEVNEKEQKRPKPIRDIVNKYADVIASYDPTQSNPLGDAWLRKFQPGGIRIGDEMAENQVAASVVKTEKKSIKK